MVWAPEGFWRGSNILDTTFLGVGFWAKNIIYGPLGLKIIGFQTAVFDDA